MANRKEGLEKLVAKLSFDGNEGEFEIVKEARLCKITYNGIKLYEKTLSEDAFKIPIQAKKIRYYRNGPELKVEFVNRRKVASYTKKFDLVLVGKEAIQKGIAIKIPEGATHYSCKNGHVLFYVAFDSKCKRLCEIPKGAVAISFDDFEKSGEQYYYGKPVFR
jgi:hypothetical protein